MTFNWVIQNQSIASEILHSQIATKEHKSHLLPDEKGPHKWIQVVIRLYINTNNLFCKEAVLISDSIRSHTGKKDYYHKLLTLF